MLTTDKKRKELGVALQQFYQKPATKFSLELFLSIGLTLFLIVAAIQPTLITMTDLTKEINEKKEIDEKLPKKIAALSSAQVEYLNSQDKLALLDEAIPQKIDIVRYLKIIEYEASNNSLAILSLNTGHFQEESKKKTDSTKQLATITISVDGSYADINKFIKALEQSRVSFLIHSVSFVTKKIHNKQHLIANINLSIPYFSQ